MQIEIYFSHSFINENSEIYKIRGQDANTNALDVLGAINLVKSNSSSDAPKTKGLSTPTTAVKMYKDGWKLAHAIKTSQSAQLESFNFLLIFEK
jgi:hypothetical protein